MHTQRLIFTDLDGSLINHHDYSHTYADPVLTELSILDIPVIPCTSKTFAEVRALTLPGLSTNPFIVENGAAIYIPVGYFAKQPQESIVQGSYWVYRTVASRNHWLALLKQTSLHFHDDEFTHFKALGHIGIASLTALSVRAAVRANQREHSEPLQWRGSSQRKQAFIHYLHSKGGQVQQGGRFLTLSGACSKGSALQWLLKQYVLNQPEKHFYTVACGDSDNDMAMLECANQAVIIRAPHHSTPCLQRKSGVIHSHYFGDRGWAETVSQLLSQWYDCKQQTTQPWVAKNQSERLT